MMSASAMMSAGDRPTVVFGVDALEPEPMALAWAADEADRRGLPLRLLHAVPPVVHERRGSEEDRYHELLRERGDAALAKAADLARTRHPGLEIATVVTDGSAARVLGRESAHAELVVLGSRRMNRLEELLSAFSVTVPVSAQANCPVVVVRGPEHVTQDPPYVVVGVDGSESSAAAVDVAFDFAARRRAALRAVWVWQSQLIAHVDERAAVQTLRRQLAETTAGRAASFPDLHLTHEVIRGHPVEELAKTSEHALAVVVGRRGRGGFTGMRLGSVPHGLLHRAHSPVVTVPRPS
ncbi:universal stress protein [Kitasatospora sp. A2-31]|uniref:universal stress protein n=1 Tax=Kitasatospora sp. A2-31 TaxID=2916414 RepID=UPI001EEABDF7|nr:universal stress protein [Kitasatospora sp. A2-31]MCG6498383.1 universal stress protein [Kitasatospora sp. A2-31]